jgi:hypothetical protein
VAFDTQITCETNSKDEGRSQTATSRCVSRRFIVVFIRACPDLSSSHLKPAKNTKTLRYILILFSHIFLERPIDLSASDFPEKLPYIFLIPLVRVIFPAYFLLGALLALTIFGEQYKS